MSHSTLGSCWNRWDLHFHTPSSFDYENKGISNESIVKCLLENNIRVVAITDHHEIDVDRIRDLKNIAGDRITILPGIELRSEYGGHDSVHYIGIFPEDCNIQNLHDAVVHKLDLIEKKKKYGDEKIYVEMQKAAALFHQLGGLVSIHAGTKSNSINEISNAEQFKQQLKTDITQELVDLYEIGKPDDMEAHLDIIFPAIGKELPLLLCSDNHDAANYSAKRPMWLRADPLFRGLRMVIREPLGRVYLGEKPPDITRVEQDRTRYVRGVEFARGDGAPNGQQWFSGRVEFNSGLVAIIGNKGSGKSALSDTLGLLGNSKNHDSFSFLCPDRFRHPRTGLASHFSAVIEWASGESVRLGLHEASPAEAVERIKYLPQQHVESVCTELSGAGAGKFERELEAVIFSHVPDEERLGQSSLDELLRKHTESKTEKIASLQKSLLLKAKERVRLERQADPAKKTELVNRLEAQQVVLAAHDKARPQAVNKPDEKEGVSKESRELTEQIAALEESKEALVASVRETELTLTRATNAHATSLRLLEGLRNLVADVDSAKERLERDAVELGLSIDELVSTSVNEDAVTNIRDSNSREKERLRRVLEGEVKEEKEILGLRKQVADIDSEIEQIRKKLGAPERAYQQYLAQEKAWRIKRAEIEGSEEQSDSIKGLEKAIADLGLLPKAIAAAKEQLVAEMQSIFAVKKELVETYRTLYGPVQKYVAEQYDQQQEPPLTFQAELSPTGFEDRLLQMLAQNRKGTFRGTAEGRERLAEMLKAVDWGDANSVETAINSIDGALHEDQRSNSPEIVTLASQLASGYSAENLYAYLYGLDYLSPRYHLQWEGKDLGVLSAGERGSVLLLFYLLIDKSRQPLIIDQPEGNLDNHTVARVLVESIKKARNHRQVFIVTHNPNLAVVCDADQVIHASIDKENGNAITYESGSLENPAIARHVLDVLEGTLPAFRVRDMKYLIAQDETLG